MPNARDRIDAAPTNDGSSGWMASLLAEEDAFDRRILWRLGTWAGCAVGLLTVAILAARSSEDLRRQRLAYAEMSQQAQKVQWIAKESQDEARRLAAAVDTLNTDRDRLYSRVTVLEQNLDSVTGSITRQSSTISASALPSPSTSPTTTVASLDPALTPDKKSEGKSDPKTETTAIPLTPAPVRPIPQKPLAKAAVPTPADTKVPSETESKQGDAEHGAASVIASAAAQPDSQAASLSKPVERTEFGVDIGTANSVEGLRALWRGSLATQSPIIGGMQPIIVVKERNDGFGLQLRLVAGPISNAADAAKVCAQLIANKRGCETSVYNGQRLAMGSDAAAAPAAVASAPKKQRRVRAKPEEPPPAPRGFTSIFGR